MQARRTTSPSRSTSTSCSPCYACGSVVPGRSKDNPPRLNRRPPDLMPAALKHTVAHPAPANTEPAEARAKILLVDDDERNLLALSEVLSPLADVVTATSG